MYGAGIRGLPVAQFGFPGPLRDQLVAAILSGQKTATSSLLLEYELDPGDPMPEVGGRSLVVDSAGRPVCVIETTEVRVLPLRGVDEQFARDEGEDFASVEEWRAAHEAFWHSEEMREAIGRRDFLVGDDTIIVAERFRVVERLG
jgi:uncharacterized protein YhfF